MTKNKTKKGAASIYAVVFATLLLGIVTVSFVRLIIRESTDTTNNDLSRSSRDSALAGVEDAKRAIDAYQNPALDNSGGLAVYGSCDFVSQVLYGTSDEVKIEETRTGNSKTEQAYTCVQVDPNSEDYKGHLDDVNSIAIIPLKHDATKNVRYVTFSWQEANTQSLSYPNSSYYKDINAQSVSGSSVPPVISLQYLQAPTGSFDPVSTYDMKDDPNTALMFLTPKANGTSIKTITKYEFPNYHKNLTGYSTIAGFNSIKPVDITCNKDGIKDGFVCSVAIELPTSADGKNKYLVASLPYGSTATEFSAKMYAGDFNNESNRLDFQGVQYKVDSTGRANDLYTRLEVRLDTTDPSFPYPQFALQTEESLVKYFWVTQRQCVKINDGEFASECNNSGDAY